MAERRTVLFNPLLDEASAFLRSMMKRMEDGASSNAAVGIMIGRAIDTFPDNKEAVLESVGFALARLGDDDLLGRFGIKIDPERYRNPRNPNRKRRG